MGLIVTDIPGIRIIEPRVFEDDRGCFFESYNANTFRSLGIDATFVQDNQAKSRRGVIRGLHYQIEPHAQAKLVRVLTGAILDVAVDIRQGSPTFGKHVAVELSEKNRLQIFVPRGFAHGYSVISETAEIFYKCDNFYTPEADTGIAWNDPALGIDWRIDPASALLSPKDLRLPPLAQAKNNFHYRSS